MHRHRTAPVLLLVFGFLLALVSFRSTFASDSPPLGSAVAPQPRPLASVSPGTYENENPNLVYTGMWELRTNQNASAGTFRRSETDGNTVSLTVVGATSVYIGIIKNNSFGKAKVLLDGVQVTGGNFDCYAANFTAVETGAYAIPDLNAHTLTVSVLHKKQDASSGCQISPKLHIPSSAKLYHLKLLFCE